jgi:uncharacterized membrane-anchored protein
MKKIINYVFIGAGIYFGINWIADNPGTINHTRTKMNKAVKKITEEVKKQL